MRHSFATVYFVQQMICEHVAATPKTTSPRVPRWIPLAFFSPFEVPPAPRHPAVRDRCGAKFSWVISTTSRTRFWAVGRQTPAPRSGTNGAMTSGRRPSARGVSDFPLPRYIHRSPLSISISVNPPRPGHCGRDAARDHRPPSRRVANYAGRHERPARDEAS